MGKYKEKAGEVLVSLIDYSVLQGTSLVSGSTQASEWMGDVQKSKPGHIRRPTHATV